MAKHITLLLILAVAPLLQSNSLQVDLPDEPFDFEQIERDSKAIFQNNNRIDFDWNEPAHQYFFWINLADMATTIYAMENRDSLYEGNFLLDDKPRPEELLLQKVAISYFFHEVGMFSGNEITDDWLSIVNTVVTLATINNLRLIQKND